MSVRRARFFKIFVSLLMILLMLSIPVAAWGNEPVQNPPVADPNGPYAGHAGYAITFDGSGSFDPDGGIIVMYGWSFGDGGTYTETISGAPDGAFDGMAQYSYPVPGTYIVTLAVADESGDMSYGETFAEITIPPSTVEAEIDFKPMTLNLASNGRYMTCYIELPPPYHAADIDVSTVYISEINGIPVNIPVQDEPTEVGDYDGDGISDLMVKVDRGEIEDAVPIPVEIVELDLVGEAPAGVSFSGSDTVKVTKPKVVERERLADGTHYWKYADGLEHWKYPNGTELWKWPDGMEHWIFPDGTELWIHPDGLKHWIYPDGSELWIHPDGTRHWKRADGTDVWIFPSDIQRIRNLINQSKFQEAINETIRVYKINLTVTGRNRTGANVSKTARVIYNASVKGDGQTTPCGLVEIGPAAFTNHSVGWLASTIQHELVHVKQDAEGRWYTGDQGWAMNEVEAYDHELANADQKGLTAAEKKDLQTRRNSWYNRLNDANKKRVDRGDYSLPPGQENT